MFRFWRNMDDDDKSRLVRIIGLVVALAAVFTLLSTVSYFFTWKADQSSLTSAGRHDRGGEQRRGKTWLQMG